MINKFAPKREKYLIDLSDIDERICYIDGFDDYYISENGNIYREYLPGKYYKLKPYINKRNGYAYANLMCNGKHKSFRVHIKVALYFIPNPNHYPIVGHKDNIKSHNNVDNLYWTTNKENIQKAVNDGLLVNDKGENDSQSMQVACFDINRNFIRFYGSVSEAHRNLGISKSTVLRQSNHEINGKPRCGYYFRFKDEYLEKGFVL